MTEKSAKSILEKIFEKCLWSSRCMILLAVIFSLLGAFVLFVIASVDILESSMHAGFGFLNSHNSHEEIVISIIRAIDLYLVAVVLIIFSFGLYELFISKIDYFYDSEASDTLKIHSLEELKNKLGKTIIMVLIVYFFKKIMYMDFKTPLEMLYLAISIFVLALALYFSHKKDDNH